MSLTEYLLTNLKQRLSGLELIPSKGGCFEVTVGDQLIYSKLETDEFPDECEILRAVQGVLDAAA